MNTKQKPVFDRMPPQNIEAEQATLAAILINGDAIGTVIEALGSDETAFYGAPHQNIYAACVSLFRRGISVDPVTVMDEMKRSGTLESAGGVNYLGDLISATPTSANVQYHAADVAEAASRRRIISDLTDVVGRAYSPDDGTIDELLTQAGSTIFGLASAGGKHRITPVGDLALGTLEEIEARYRGDIEFSGLPTGFSDLDAILGGLAASDMIIIAARPSVGKTALALNIARHAAVDLKKSALIFSLEMNAGQITKRLLGCQARADIRRIESRFSARQELEKLSPAMQAILQAPIYICDSPSLNMLEIRSKAIQHCQQHKDTSLVIIDYMQLIKMSGRVESRQVGVAQISSEIKAMARELRLPVIALSQLSREAEKDDVGRPKLSHLRESGSIEQDADVAILMWREQKKDDQAKNQDVINIDVAKHRNGPTGKLKLVFHSNLQRFENCASGVTIIPNTFADNSMPDDDYDDQPF
jgi:replicative DNA helicase